MHLQLASLYVFPLIVEEEFDYTLMSYYNICNRSYITMVMGWPRKCESLQSLL